MSNRTEEPAAEAIEDDVIVAEVLLLALRRAAVFLLGEKRDSRKQDELGCFDSK